MKFTKLILPLTLMVCACLFAPPMLTGCASRLEPGGAYARAGAAPDKGFFVVDAAYDIAYSTIDTAFSFEKKNRALLWQISPEIKHGLDAIRPKALAIAREYTLARKAYKLNPTPANLDTLQTILGRTRQLATAAQAALPK